MPEPAVTERAVASVLEVEGVSVSYPDGRGGRRLVVDDVSFELRRGEMFGLVGESGSGKSTTAMAILGLIREPGRVEAGRVLLDGVDLRELSREALRRERWRSISLVPQGAMSALNPVMRVGAQIADVIVQREVAETLKSVQARLGMAVVLIGHDMALQAQLVDRVGVMCQGRLVEVGPVRAIFREPAHPYTKLLLQAVPSLREREWRPAAATEALRAEALRLVSEGHPLVDVGPDHRVALP
jgi:ABC-type glutathione transport system ATPase component